MIKLQEMTPEVYYKKSRDFQFIGRLYDLVLNHVKTNADLINTLPMSQTDNDQRMIDLMAMTLGFKSKHNYNLKQLTALCSAFTSLLKIKGTTESIKTACDVLLRAEGIREAAIVTVDQVAYTVEISVPSSLTDTNLLKDLLVYLLPAGMCCNITKVSTLKSTPVTTLYFAPEIKKNIRAESDISTVITKEQAPTESFKGLIGDASGYFMNTTVVAPIPTNQEDKNDEQKEN